ncbi:conserved hypothetical protein [Histoplasma capsulatum G186AR]|uniref:DUF7371 domain-containing protein n=1 Tax=Ajellomyces capsulatus (strain G186AR / H82 / ATCC MYA-2454 / RMSCC 2432) TaxID=447093 RepID=C0NGQ3_AJECG|nr:uncharacterized protein HCBG_02525 [Histoplasma capsulatum G186AR]EEH08988.1 conserved hypothetical protein [Histoplasma capsulatum G186AR]
MRVLAVIGVAFFALAAGARLPRSWSDTNEEAVTVTTTVLPKDCVSTETSTNDQVVTITTTIPPQTCTSPEIRPSTRTITETVYITLTLFISPVRSTVSSNDELTTLEETLVTYTTATSRFETKSTVTNASGNDVSSQHSTFIVTLRPVPVSESTTIITSVSTEVVTFTSPFTLVDVPSSNDLPDKPPPPTIMTDSKSAQASKISVTPPAPSTLSTIAGAPSTSRLSTRISHPIITNTTTVSAVPSKPYGPSGWNFTNPANGTAQTTGVQCVSGHPNPNCSKPPIVSISKRQVGVMVTATINGQIVSWINRWDGGALSSPTPSTQAPIIEITRTKSTPSSTPTKCGESGEFTMDFDDLPRYSPSDNDTAPFPPIFNPHNHLFFSDGWSYGPPPTEPYPPTSNPHIGIYIPEKSKDNRGSPYAGLLAGGAFGAGPRSSLNTFWFDAYSANFGCDNGFSNTTCAVTVSAVRYSTLTKTEEAAGIRKFTLPPCPGYKGCTLSPLDFGDSFRGISGLQFSASVRNKSVILFVDDIKMNWYNNSCAAGLERLRSR